MSKQINIGVGGTNHKAKPYIGVGGVVKKVKAVYAGIGGVVKQLWQSILYLIDSINTFNCYTCYQKRPTYDKWWASTILSLEAQAYRDYEDAITYPGNVTVCVGEAIDLTSFSKVYVEVTNDSTGTGTIYVSNVPDGDTGYIAGVSCSVYSNPIYNRVYSFDISNVNGIGYIKVRFTTSDYRGASCFTVHRIWLE